MQLVHSGYQQMSGFQNYGAWNPDVNKWMKISPKGVKKVQPQANNLKHKISTAICLISADILH